jgi:hypothetical protein
MAARRANPDDARMKTLLQDPDLIRDVDKLLEQVEQRIAGTRSTQKQNCDLHLGLPALVSSKPEVYACVQRGQRS